MNLAEKINGTDVVFRNNTYVNVISYFMSKKEQVTHFQCCIKKNFISIKKSIGGYRPPKRTDPEPLPSTDFFRPLKCRRYIGEEIKHFSRLDQDKMW